MSLPHSKPSLYARVRRNVIAGLIAAFPIYVTWAIFDFLARQLTNVGAPPLALLARAIRPFWPEFAEWLIHPRFQSVLAVLVVLVAIGILGWITNRVIGQRLMDAFEAFVGRVPLVEKVYGAVKQLLTALQRKPEGVERVVLIDFPSPEMKAVGLVTRTFRDSVTGRPLAAVYVPTTPNPTSGYLEIVPLDKVTPTEWTVDEAMNFIVSGGAVAPETLRYEREGPPAPEGLPEQKTL